MSARDNGGPAFPSGNEVTFGDWISSGHSGMTLRDYFAAKALSGLLAQQGIGRPPAVLAALAYEQADAMLGARSK